GRAFGTLSTVEIDIPILLSPGSPCAAFASCASGFCVDSVCCDTACNAGPCEGCSKAKGAPVDGTCSLLTGPVCDDGDLCTQGDQCQAGVCVGAHVVTCPEATACHPAGVCDPKTGVCSAPVDPDGAPCDDGDACTRIDTCQKGVCTGS